MRTRIYPKQFKNKDNSVHVENGYIFYYTLCYNWKNLKFPPKYENDFDLKKTTYVVEDKPKNENTRLISLKWIIPK